MSIIKQYKSRKKKVYAAFIDLRKAFDSVWKESLFYEIIIAGIPNKLFQMIYSMYQFMYKMSNQISQWSWKLVFLNLWCKARRCVETPFM